MDAIRKATGRRRKGEVDMEPMRKEHADSLAEHKTVIAEFRRVERMVDTNRTEPR